MSAPLRSDLGAFVQSPLRARELEPGEVPELLGVFRMTRNQDIAGNWAVANPDYASPLACGVTSQPVDAPQGDTARTVQWFANSSAPGASPAGIQASDLIGLYLAGRESFHLAQIGAGYPAGAMTEVCITDPATHVLWGTGVAYSMPTYDVRDELHDVNANVSGEFVFINSNSGAFLPGAPVEHPFTANELADLSRGLLPAPVLTPIADWNPPANAAGQTYDVTQETPAPVYPVTFSMTGAPVGYSIIKLTDQLARITATPDTGPTGGPYPVTVRAENAAGFSESTFNLTVGTP